MRILLWFGLVCSLAIPSQSQSRSVAITIDDLPCTNCSPVNPNGTSRQGYLVPTNKRLVAELARAHIPATGFVITKNADEAGKSGDEVLQSWLDAGLDLGSHSYSHPNFDDITETEMEAQITRADAALRPLLSKSGRKLRFFRFPYNATGDTQAKHDGIATFLHDHGYQLATCTIETSDYIFAQAYVRALGANDDATAARIRMEYLSYSATEIDFYAALNRRVLGYEPPEVMLIHDSLLNADTIVDLLSIFRARGYQFVSLADAQRDPAYAIPDTYVTKYGPAWGYRWAKERNIGKLNMRKSELPDWIERYANGEPAKGHDHPVVPKTQ